MSGVSCGIGGKAFGLLGTVFTWRIAVPSVRVGSIQTGVGITSVCVTGVRNLNPFPKNRKPSRVRRVMIPIPSKTATRMILVLFDEEEFWFLLNSGFMV